jgi:DNA repair protein RecN (Recombination protein N)
MLKHLLIRNIALIDEITLSFERGLNILTGETGAGKSIVVDAVSILLGGRADRDRIRSGCEKAYVEGTFSIDNTATSDFLRDREIEAEDSMILLSREFNAAGRNVCRLCGIGVTLSVFRQAAALLMDLHAQHEQQSLLDEKTHIRYLDDYGDESHQALRLAAGASFAEYKAAKSQYDSLLAEGKQREERMDLLRFQEKELSAAGLTSGEDESLAAERDRFRNAEKIERSLRTAFTALYAAEGRAEPAAGLIQGAMQALGEIAGLGEDLSTLHSRVQSLYFDTEDIGLAVRSLLERVETDPGRMEAVTERLDLIRRLSRKYGPTASGMLDKLEAIRAEIQGFDSLEDNLNIWDRKQKALLADCRSVSLKLSSSRQALARQFEELVENHLKELNMAGTRFYVCIAINGDALSPEGYDRVEFMIAPNAGEGKKPLSKTASGGELSRLMLAVKSIYAERSDIPAMVFDEIDTGISGRTAQVVAEKLWDIARFRQVICVTHLPQIAAMASGHYLVEKNAQGGRMLTGVRLLNLNERERELSHMLSGVSQDSESSVSHARAMLAEAEHYKS